MVLGIGFILAGINHFRVPGFYVALMPDYIPAHTWMVHLSGATEMVAGILLLIPRTTRWGAWFIVVHLLAFLTVHIWMIQHATDRYAKIPMVFLWVRLVFQFVFLAWAVWYTRPELSSVES